jgi:homoserine kinase
MNSVRTARAFAPASVANVAVGFDILGFSFAGVGDTVELTWDPSSSRSGVSVNEMRDGRPGLNAEKLPKDSLRNTSAVSAQAMMNALNLPGEVKLTLTKGIPLSSGMGGSASSAVASVVALNSLLDQKLDWPQLLEYALEGERVASGAVHYDNVLPSLRGGLNLMAAPGHFVKLTVPSDLYCALVHPEIEIQTRFARSLLSDTTSLKLHIQQSAYLGGFLAACFQSNWDLMKASLHDVIIEPQRMKLIPGFAQAKDAALKAGALGFSISGSGPTVFALCRGQVRAEKAAVAIRSAFEKAELKSESWIAPVEAEGAKLV